MNKQQLIEKIKAMIASPSCHPDLKKVANAYLNALALEQMAADNLLAALEDNLVDIDEMLDMAHSDEGVKCFGVEGAKKFAASAEALKASGAEYCNCLACSIAREVLDHKQLLRS